MLGQTPITHAQSPLEKKSGGKTMPGKINAEHQHFNIYLFITVAR